MNSTSSSAAAAVGVGLVSVGWVIAAAHASAAGGTWQAVPAVPGATFGGPLPAQGPPTAEGHRHCPNVLDWVE